MPRVRDAGAARARTAPRRAVAPRPAPPPRARDGPGRSPTPGSSLLFLGLTFLLGVFPLKDTDFWWHLRTGDLIRQTGSVPRRRLVHLRRGRARLDRPALGLPGRAELALRASAGVDATNLAKCASRPWPSSCCVTARTPRLAALGDAPRPGSPRLLVLGGRMYVRPETLTLLYLAIYLAVLVPHRPHARGSRWLLPVGAGRLGEHAGPVRPRPDR